MAQTEIEPTVKPEHAALIAELEAESSYVKLSKFLESLPDDKEAFDNFIKKFCSYTKFNIEPEKVKELVEILTNFYTNKADLEKAAFLGERNRRLEIGAELATDDYRNDPELTIFTKSLEGEPFYEFDPELGDYRLPDK